LRIHASNVVSLSIPSLARGIVGGDHMDHMALYKGSIYCGSIVKHRYHFSRCNIFFHLTIVSNSISTSATYFMNPFSTSIVMNSPISPLLISRLSSSLLLATSHSSILNENNFHNVVGFKR